MIFYHSILEGCPDCISCELSQYIFLTIMPTSSEEKKIHESHVSKSNLMAIVVQNLKLYGDKLACDISIQ